MLLDRRSDRDFPAAHVDRAGKLRQALLEPQGIAHGSEVAEQPVCVPKSKLERGALPPIGAGTKHDDPALRRRQEERVLTTYAKGSPQAAIIEGENASHFDSARLVAQLECFQGAGVVELEDTCQLLRLGHTERAHDVKMRRADLDEFLVEGRETRASSH